VVTSLRNEAGCLTDAGLDALEQASPGQAPDDLVRHLAECARCQNRVLVRAGGSAEGRRPARTAPRRIWVNMAIVLGAMLAALVALLGTLFWLRTPPE
jgi:hypothetical protein